MMLHPTIEDLTKGKINRYELAIATAKCARTLNDDYVAQKELAEKAAMAGICQGAPGENTSKRRARSHEQARSS